ncbi:MAG TPA: glycosyltransferase family 39 protein [Candidatus Baltobacteraceae bacterium]
MTRLPRGTTTYIATGMGLAATLLHAFAALRYGYYRDELYFIACAQHLAWGYPDQPPLVAVTAWLAGPFGYALLAVRGFPILAAGGAVAATCLVARELGGNRIAVVLAGLLALLLPTSLFLGSTLTTTSFEPLTWTLAIWLVLRIARGDDSRLWYAVAVVTAFSLYGKYSIVLLLVALKIGLLLTPQRRILYDRRLIAACVLALVLVLPNLMWQISHGLPFLAVMHEDIVGRQAFNSGVSFESADLVRNAGLFLGEQLLFANLFALPIWILGVVALLRGGSFSAARFLGVAFLVLLVIALALAAKGYYIAGVYPALCAVGAVWLASLRLRWPVRVLGSVAVVGGIAFAPMFAPFLDVSGLIAYQAALGIPPARANPPHFVQPLFAEEFGWNELARRVGKAYADLSAATRARTAIFADTYGDAAALDFYGPRYGLPPAISGQNAYYDWGPRNYDGSTVIAIGASQQVQLRAVFRHVTLIETYLHPDRWSAEGPTPIWLCTDPIAPLAQLWPRFKWYGA